MGERRLAIVGVGLIGGSVALAARRAGGWRVVGCDPAAGGSAASLGVVDEVALTPGAAATGADLVVLAVPVAAAAGVLATMPADVLVTDAGSTKRSIVAAAAGRRFVGAHPMAGGERGGVAHARADLFDGAVCLLTPTDTADPADVAAVEAFWRSLGSTTVRLSPDRHDAAVADVSHVPHVVAGAVARAANPSAVPFGAGGWRDVTRVAGGNPDLWRDILLDNRDCVASALRRVRDDLDAMIAHIDSADAAAVRAWLAAATRVKADEAARLTRPG